MQDISCFWLIIYYMMVLPQKAPILKSKYAYKMNAYAYHSWHFIII